MPKGKSKAAFEFFHNDIHFYFTKKNYVYHCAYHYELRPPTWETFKQRIIKAVIQPDFVYPSFHPIGRYCCYYKEFEIDKVTRYTKVVIAKVAPKSYEIITAFRPTSIKEKLYYNNELEERPWL